MEILKRRRPPIPYKLIYLSAIVFSIVVLIQSSSIGKSTEMEIKLEHVVLFSINYLVWAMLIDWVYGVTKPLDNFPNVSFESVLKLLFNAILIIILHLVISNFLFYIFWFSVSDITVKIAVAGFKAIVIRALLSRTLDLVVIVSILKLIDTYNILQRRKLQVVKLENQLHTSQLKALKAQLNPHFLFNVLHALHTLIGHDDTKAKSMVIKVSGLLRKMLAQQDRHTVVLEDELDYLKDYLEIEKERFHDRLSISFDVQEEAKSLVVPALLLQPLAENAFKHGISMVEGKGVISLSCKIRDGQLLIEMSNTVPENHQPSTILSTGVGLSNLRKRLKELYGDEYALKTERTNDIFTIFITMKATLEP